MQRAILMGQEGVDATIAAIARMTELPAKHHPRRNSGEPSPRSGCSGVRTQPIAHGPIGQPSTSSQQRHGHLAVWNGRLLMVAIALVMWSATMLALQMAGPTTAAFLAGEGTTILPDSW
jgi:hypothetical protein